MGGGGRWREERFGSQGGAADGLMGGAWRVETGREKTSLWQEHGLNIAFLFILISLEKGDLRVILCRNSTIFFRT